jgi:glycosyltransferase involved in cell wall biosynthesis
MDWLSRAFKSAKGFYEIIIVDDCSDTPVPHTTIRHEKNMGFYNARNTGVAYATGDWIASLDDDDYFDEPGLVNMFKLIEKTSEDIIYFPMNTFTNSNPNTGMIFKNGNNLTFDKLKENNMLPSGSWFRKSVWNSLGGFQYEPAEDWDFWLRAMKSGFKFKFYPNPVYWHRVRSDSKWEKNKHRLPEIRKEVNNRVNF